MLRQLHWLPVRLRITSLRWQWWPSSACTVRRHPTRLTYLLPFRPSSAGAWPSRDCFPEGHGCGRRQQDSLVVLRTRITVGRRDFAVSCPVTWNSFSGELRTSSLSIDSFDENSKFTCCLPAPLRRTLFNRRYRPINWRIHSLILNTECDANCDTNSTDLDCLKLSLNFIFVQINDMI